MNINGINIITSDENRTILKDFFYKNEEFIKDRNFLYYEDIKTLGDLLEKYIDDNNLRNNDFIMLFLAEIRVSELEYKITDKINKIRAKRMCYPKKRANETINRWYLERTLKNNFITTSNTDRQLEKRINQDIDENITLDNNPEKNNTYTYKR